MLSSYFIGRVRYSSNIIFYIKKLSNFPIAKEEVETNEGKIMRFNGSKMLPLSNGNGFAIRWNTGKVSKFEVFFDEV